MYRITADGTLIYDSTLEDFKINKGSISLEVNKSGSFNFSLYPDHFYYNNFVKLKTVITTYKNNKIVFRGRVLNDSDDFWNNKSVTCEGELGFFQDSVIRPFEKTGTPEEVLKFFVNAHNSQVDEFKRFKVGTVTMTGTITVSNTMYQKTLENINNQLINNIGGYLFITHGENGTEEIPTIHYLSDFTKVSSQPIEFGVNLKDYTKKTASENIITAIIPLGSDKQVETGETDESGNKVTKTIPTTIEEVNDGKDFVYDEDLVNEYGWVFAPVEWKDIADPETLKKTAKKHFKNSLLNVTVELNAVDLALFNRSIESYNVCEYIPVISTPHNFQDTLLCNKQTIDLLNPNNDTITLGHTYTTFTERTNKITSTFNNLSNIQATVYRVSNTVGNITINTDKLASDMANNYNNVNNELGTIKGDNEAIASAVVTNAQNIATNAQSIADHSQAIEDIIARLEELEG